MTCGIYDSNSMRFCVFVMHNVCSVLRKLPVAALYTGVPNSICAANLYSLKFALEHRLIVWIFRRGFVLGGCIWLEKKPSWCTYHMIFNQEWSWSRSQWISFSTVDGYLSLVTWSGPGAPWLGTQLKISLRSGLDTIVLFVTNPLFKANLVVRIIIVPTPHHPLYSLSKSVLQTSRKTNHSVSAISALLKSDSDPGTPSFPSLVVTRIERCWIQGAARN